MQAKEPIRIRSVTKITDYRHVNLFEIAYQDVQGQPRIWHMASRNPQPKCVTERFDSPDAVIIVAHHVQSSKLVTIREFRVSLNGYQYGFPAGLLDPGETVEQTAVRELYEETGLSVTRIMKASPPVYSSSGLTDESVSIVYVECSGTPSREGNTSTEDIQTLLVTPREASDLCGDKDLRFDAKTWIILSEFARTGIVS